MDKIPFWVKDFDIEDEELIYTCPNCKELGICENPGPEIFTCKIEGSPACGTTLAVPYPLVISIDSGFMTEMCELIQEKLTINPEYLGGYEEAFYFTHPYNLLIVDLDKWANFTFLEKVFEQIPMVKGMRIVFVISNTQNLEKNGKSGAFLKDIRNIGFKRYSIVYRCGPDPLPQIQKAIGVADKLIAEEV